MFTLSMKRGTPPIVCSPGEPEGFRLRWRGMRTEQGFGGSIA
jgi:hypothetical protein